MLGAWGVIAAFASLWMWATGPVDDPISLALMGLGVGLVIGQVYCDYTVRRLELRSSQGIGWGRR